MKFGWKPDLPDHRDHLYRATKPTRWFLPSKVDLRTTFKNIPILDQGDLGSCTANATAMNVWYTRYKQHSSANPISSRLFIYYNERSVEGTVNEDSGAMLRTGMKVVADKGVCAETMWDYDVTKFAATPPSVCYDVGQLNQAIKYMRLDNSNIRELKTCLADGYPFVFGFTVYESFMSQATAQTGIVLMPSKKDTAEGGHAVLAVGYDDKKKVFIVQNSWSSNWGDKGYFYLPYNYVTNTSLADDFWTIRTMEA